jgi:hypothetical protein
MWTDVLAIYAAVISTSSLAISYLSYRSGGPQLSGDAFMTDQMVGEPPLLYIALHNRGRGPVTVDSIMLWAMGPTSVDKDPLPVTGWPLPAVSSKLPVRIEGHSGGRWWVPAQQIASEWLKRDDLVKLVVKVFLADGRLIDLVVNTTEVDELDPDNLPNWEGEATELPFPTSSSGDETAPEHR